MTVSSAVIATILSFSVSVFAVKMDESTHDQVIGRLEIGIESMEKTDGELPGIQIRLADLYADRARLKAMNESSGNCTECKASRDDRRRAIDLYQTALPRIEKEKQGKIVLQVAHIYSLLEQSEKSLNLYRKIISAKSSTYSSDVRGLAYSSLGDIYFKKGDFKNALKHFELARKEDLNNRAIVEYRISWCQLNLGQFDKAIGTLTHLLTNKDLLSTPTSQGSAIDPLFLQDASADLARFLARGPVTQKQIALIKEVSPEKTRKENLKGLAEECDRLGKKSAAVSVWAAYVDEGQVQADEKLEVQARLAQIYYDMSRPAEAVQAYEKALELWKKNGCSNKEMCEELKGRLRRFVTTWTKALGTKPNRQLFRAYVAYTQIFADAEMYHWGAQVGAKIGDSQEAGKMFHQAAVLSQKDPKQRKMFEGSLLGEIEMAEATKDIKVRENAYNFYLASNPTGDQAVQVRYQRAQLFYSQNRFKDALGEFHAIANLNGKEHMDLRVKSADLALDCLVAMKDDASLQVRGLEYARLFPERKTEYLKISRKATMNIVANNTKNDRSDFKTNLVALNQVNLEGADENEKIKFYKNKIIIAQKALDLNVVDDTADDLLAIRKLSKTDQEWAMAQKVWVAELQLNFEKAYRISRTMALSQLSKADRELRLALLADLAGLNSKPHNEAYLRLTPNSRSANLVRVTLIKNSPSPWRELDKHLRPLRSTPDLLAGITLETYARQPDLKRAEKMLKTTSIAQYPSGQTLARQLSLRDFQKFDRLIGSHRLYGYSDKAMRQTIRERLKLIGQSEHQAQKALKSHDWTLQIMTLSQLARENRRLYRDILSLPVPQKLDAEQKKQYQQLLKSQSDPYLSRAEKIETELNQMWSQSNSVQNLQNAFMTASNDLQKVYRGEVTLLAGIAPSSAQKRLQNLLNTPYRRSSQREILLARKELQASPFDISKAKQLRELEAQGGRPAMVVYLDERISQLKTGKKL